VNQAWAVDGSRKLAMVAVRIKALAMSKFADLKILYKILACFLLFGAASVATIWFATSKMSMIDGIYASLLNNEARGASDVTRANAILTRFVLSNYRIIAETQQAAMEQAVSDKQAAEKRFFVLIAEAKKHAPSFIPRLEDFQAKFEAMLPQYKSLEELALANKHDEARAVASRVAGQMGQLQQQFIAISDEMLKVVDSASDAATATTDRTIYVTFAIIAVAMVAVFSVAILLVQTMIAGPIARLVPELTKLAEGDFNVSLTSNGRKDEIGQITAAVETVVEKVGATIGNIKMSANEVTNASAEISTSTTDLSQRTEEQAASLEETSASMAEIADTVRKNAENARQANDFATETSAVAERGGAVVSEAVTAMAHIEESSQKISDIIGVIDEIARQTNLLALNAAVEAARAGEAGRGFAVVASEVRSLAQRSSQAAKDIKDLITNSNSQVKNGVELVNKAGESLAEITASIRKVASVVADIAHASLEQSTGIEQVNKALTQMDEVTQQNSALVEENAATARTLESQAKSMDERVAMFRLRGGERAVRAERAAVRTREVAEETPVAAPAPKPRRAPVRMAAAGGARRMQTALAAAVQSESDWKDF
jgi:methyl-accepting chemotaxis protein